MSERPDLLKLCGSDAERAWRLAHGLDRKLEECQAEGDSASRTLERVGDPRRGECIGLDADRGARRVDLVRDQRAELMARIRELVDHEATSYGIQVVDVRAPERVQQGSIDLAPPGRFHNIRGSELVTFRSLTGTAIDPQVPIAVVCGRVAVLDQQPVGLLAAVHRGDIPLELVRIL